MAHACVSAGKLDVWAVGDAQQVDLKSAFARLAALYEEVDARNAELTLGLDLPCQRGCDACCHESVFLTHLEFLYAWHWLQEHLAEAEQAAIIARGLALYEKNRDLIEALQAQVEAGTGDPWPLARQLKYRCPILGADGRCQIYPARELLARLFGCSMQPGGAVYGCGLTEAHLRGKTVTLLPAQGTAQRLRGWPLCESRQVYPYYLHAYFS